MQTLKEMDAIVGEGVTSFKLFMAYPGVLYSDDGQIFRAMQQAAESGTTIMMHAENGIAIDVLREQAATTRPDRSRSTTPRPGRRPPSPRPCTAPSPWRSSLAAPLYIVHMSAKEAVVELTRARDRGPTCLARRARTT